MDVHIASDLLVPLLRRFGGGILVVATHRGLGSLGVEQSLVIEMDIGAFAL